jgi:hypothetical protein
LRGRSTIVLAALTALLIAAAQSARAFDETKYPDLTGQWLRMGSGSYDPSKPADLGQEAPLTPEYRALWEKSIADVAVGGQGNNPMGACIPPGLPRTMINYEGMEIIVTPPITYILLQEPEDQIRRIYTDGRPWPADPEPAFLGHSHGQWVDENGDGRYDALLIETRALKLPRSYDSSGTPFHTDGQAVIKERFSVDKTDPDVLHDEITSIDHALTRPWTVTRSYRRTRKPSWVETVCAEDNHHVKIGGESYYLDANGELMPTRKGQPPPSLRHFGEAK